MEGEAEEQIVEQSLQHCLMLEDQHLQAIRSGNFLWWLVVSPTKTDPRQAFRRLQKDYTGQPVRTGYQPVNLAQCLRSSASPVLDGRRFSNRRWGRRWRRWSGNRLVGGRFCLGLIQNTVHLRLELAIHGPRFPIEVLGLGVRPDGFLSEKSFPNFGGRFAVVQRPSRPLPEVSPVLPGKITQPHRAALAPPDAFRTLPYAGQEFLQGGGEHWPFYFRRTPRL